MKKLIICLVVSAICFSGCNNNSKTGNSNMQAEKNKQTALISAAALNKKDVEGVLKNCSADFVDYGNGGSKPIKNLDSIKAGMKAYLAAFPDYEGKDLKAVAEDDSVIVTGQWSGTFKNEFMKMKPTGKSFNLTDADIFTFNKDGKITSHRAIQSEIAYSYQLGMPMPSGK